MESRLPEEDRTKGLFSCSICNRLVNQVAESFDLGESDEEIASGIGDLCVESGAYNYKVCYGTALIAMVAGSFQTLFLSIIHSLYYRYFVGV